VLTAYNQLDQEPVPSRRFTLGIFRRLYAANDSTNPMYWPQWPSRHYRTTDM